MPSESFHRSSWDSRTCYPSRATNHETYLKTAQRCPKKRKNNEIGTETSIIVLLFVDNRYGRFRISFVFTFIIGFESLKTFLEIFMWLSYGNASRNMIEKKKMLK